MRKETCSFHHLQKLGSSEIFDRGEVEDPIFFHLRQDRNQHMLALNQGLQLPETKVLLFSMGTE